MRKYTLIASIFFAGCYHYVPVPVADAQIGARVRARVTTGTVARIERIVGPLDEPDLTGNLFAKRDSSVIIEMTTGGFRGASADPQRRELVELLPADLIALEVGRVDAARTTGFVAVIGGITAAIVKAAAHTLGPK